MQLQRWYERTRFSAEVIEEALKERAGLEVAKEAGVSREVGRGPDKWSLDTDEEFFGEYRRGFDSVSLNFMGLPSLRVWGNSENRTQITVGAAKRSEVERLFAVFDRHLEESRVSPPPRPPAPPPPKPLVFIGHGKDQSWRDLKDHLHEQHGYDVEASGE